jgi:hypothetical protein
VNAMLNLTNGVETIQRKVTLNPHLFRKMEQAQRNFKRAMWGHGGYGFHGARRKRRAAYWARLYQKWVQLLIERAQ